MEEQLLGYRTFVEIILFLVAALGGYKVQGFRKNNPNSSLGHMIKAARDAEAAKTKVEALEKNQGILFSKVDKMSDDLSYIKGQMDKE